MKNILLISTALVALPLFSRAAGGSFSQEAQGDSPSSALIGASATLANGVLTVTGSTQGEPTVWNHVFLGAETNQEAGYAHTSGKKGGKGLTYLIEGDSAYRWSGLGDHSEWKWQKLDGVPVTRTTNSNSFTVSIPVANLHLRPGNKLEIFLTTSTENYAAAVDELPRDDSVWQIEIKSSAVNGNGDGSDAASTPSADARVRFKKISNYACYYAKGAVDQLAQRDAVIIETKSQSPESITAIKKKALL